MLHSTLQPRGYLEIGVQFGDSLHLAKCPANGIDPEPRLRYHQPSARVYAQTSDQFFADNGSLQPNSDYLLGWHIDLAFIDGQHLFEYALRDFQNVERYANERTVIVFDDVLPRNQHEAARAQCPGDWTGDVWKVPKLLQTNRSRLHQHWVNTDPTGTYVVYGFDPTVRQDDIYSRIRDLGLEAWEVVPDDVINRVEAVDPQWALEQIAAHMLTLETQELG
jgi:hypothetical protein